ncbi:MAG: isocitrate lyase/phosphoenolpyruvate mutase family protein [Alcanivoracaceae bacterium]|nr:isocitrate lyase/phosphoenolpyruvate mutase family protein [Alcanivoracaceae bacterium]
MNSFKNLHTQNQPLILGNVWDVQSALLFQKLGFKAIGTSSDAIAKTLGYEDGEKIPFSQLLRTVKNIQKKTNLPLTVDIEGGYSNNTSEIIKNIISLYQLGVVGINIEDSYSNPERKIKDANQFSEVIKEINAYLVKNNMFFFINVRTDFYIMGLENPLEETIKRIKLYEDSGADGIFVPCVVNENEISEIIKSTHLPINVMCMPTLSDFHKLESLGVKRISMGPFLFNNMVSQLEKSIDSLVTNNSFISLF